MISNAVPLTVRIEPSCDYFDKQSPGQTHQLRSGSADQSSRTPWFWQRAAMRASWTWGPTTLLPVDRTNRAGERLRANTRFAPTGIIKRKTRAGGWCYYQAAVSMVQSSSKARAAVGQEATQRRHSRQSPRWALADCEREVREPPLSLSIREDYLYCCETMQI